MASTPPDLSALPMGGGVVGFSIFDALSARLWIKRVEDVFVLSLDLSVHMTGATARRLKMIEINQETGHLRHFVQL